jgi:hypothetical protein
LDRVVTNSDHHDNPFELNAVCPPGKNVFARLEKVFG